MHRLYSNSGDEVSAIYVGQLVLANRIRPEVRDARTALVSLNRTTDSTLDPGGPAKTFKVHLSSPYWSTRVKSVREPNQPITAVAHPVIWRASVLCVKLDAAFATEESVTA